jgi:hypothetical protein
MGVVLVAMVHKDIQHVEKLNHSMALDKLEDPNKGSKDFEADAVFNVLLLTPPVSEYHLNIIHVLIFPYSLSLADTKTKILRFVSVYLNVTEYKV